MQTDKSFYFILNSNTFLNKEWNFIYSKTRSFLLNLNQNQDSVANARDGLGYVILLPYHFCWGEIVTTKLKQGYLPTNI